MKPSLSLLSLGLILASGSLAAVSQAASVFVYPLEKTTETSTAQLARQYLGTSELQAVHRTEDTIYLASKDDSTRLEHNLVTGDFRFERGLERYLGDFAPKLPSADEAVRATYDFLKQNGILPRNTEELKLAHVGGLRAQSVADGKNAGPVIDKLVTLTYSRVIDGVPVIGPGSKLVVNLGEGGEVVSLARHWREVSLDARKEVSEKEVLNDDEVYALAKRQILSQFGQEALFEVRGKGLAYYDNNGGILQPVMMFETQVITSDDGVVPTNYLCVIPLLRDSPEPLNLTALDPKAKELIKQGSPFVRPIRSIGE